MFDKLIEFIKDQIKHIIPLAVIFQFQQGIRLRFGRYQKTLTPGWHFKIPYIDTVLAEQSVDTTMLLQAQSVITKDNKELIVKGSVGYRIADIAAFYCNVWDTRSALADRTCIIIKNTISEMTFNECKNHEYLDEILLELARISVENYGIEVQFVSLVDMTNSRSFRLFNEALPIN